ncbi:hypothetical protein [Formosa sp. 4Alg 33]|uniref:hypothetical protein n=1 Tax=Formosa sp. 4Alg 33 TaxID=3382189 RepID=UPI003D9C5CF6
MKKIIGFLGVAVIAMTMFFSTNTINSSTGDFDLASLININTANAEGDLCPYFKSTNYGRFTGIWQWEVIKCCTNGTAMDGCNFSLEDAECAAEIVRNEPC